MLQATMRSGSTTKVLVEHVLKYYKTSCCRPLVVVGKGAAISGAEAGLQQLIAKSGMPFLATNMGRGVVPDSHRNNCNAARSSALAGADVAIIFGAR